MKKTVGIIGLGNMGSNMAKNLLNAGVELYVYDVRQEAIDALVAIGANGTASLKELGEKSDIVFVMVLNYMQARSVTIAEDGCVSGMKKGSILIVTSTIAPSEIQEIAAAAEKYGVRTIDSPVSGGVKGSAAGTMTMMIACDDDTYNDAIETIKIVGSNATRVGDKIGVGQIVKAANQLLVSVHVTAMAEAMVMATAAGADPEVVADIIKRSVGNSYMFEEKVPLILNRDFANRGALDIQIKDMDICMKTAKEHNVPMLTAAASREVYIWANGLGYGREDLCAVVKALEQVAGVIVKGK